EKPWARRRDRKPASMVIAARQLVAGERRADPLGERERALFKGAGKDHRRVGGEIAMRRVARRLDCDAAEIEPRRQRTSGHHIVERGKNQPAEIAENIAHRLFVISTRRY